MGPCRLQRDLKNGPLFCVLVGLQGFHIRGPYKGNIGSTLEVHRIPCLIDSHRNHGALFGDLSGLLGGGGIRSTLPDSAGQK